MSHLYLIGGGPGSGKTSVAKALCQKYSAEYLKTDDLVGDHQQEAAERKLPINNYVDSLEEGEQRLELIKLTAKQELTRQEELFYILLKELRIRNYKTLVVEGNCLLPDLVAEHLDLPYSGIWLLPTMEFQNKIYLERDWVQELIKESGDPPMTLHNWIQRDKEFNEEVQRQVKNHRFPYLVIDGKKPLSYTIAWAEKQLGLQWAGTIF